MNNQPFTANQPHAGVSNPVTQAVDDKYRGFTDIPDHMKHLQDRGKPRSDSELKLVFVFHYDDSRSVDVPRVLQLLCAYGIGLQTVKQQLLNGDGASGVSMETDVSETEQHELLDDFASDADYIYCGMASKEYLERLHSAKETAPSYSWIAIYEQFIGECCKEEKSLASTVQHLRKNPNGDVKYFCKHHLIKHTQTLIERCGLLSAIATTLQSEKTALKGTENPCIVVYSDIELTFQTGESLGRFKITGQSTVPEKWKQIERKNSNMIRRIKTDVDCTSKKLLDEILTDLCDMDATRKENYIKLCNISTGLAAIVSKLNNILFEICRDGHSLHEHLSEEEMWYNGFNFSYVEKYSQHNADVRLAAEARWSKTAKNIRHNVPTKVVEYCANLHRQYGELVKQIRTQRESFRGDIKTHVSELESRIVQEQRSHNDTRKYVSELEDMIMQLQTSVADMNTDFQNKERLWCEKDLKTQQTNARLTSELDDAKYNVECVKEQIKSEWNQYLERRTEEQNIKFETQRAKARNTIAALKVEKENLLTRLSKIAGSKLVHGNPAITDLSDANRPTKLSERYSELYDNEWTDALEELIEREDICQGDDVVCTKILLAVLIESFKFCCETGAGYVRTIQQSLTTLPGCNPVTTEQEQEKQAGDTVTSLTQDQNQQLSDLVKTCVPMMTTAVESKFVTLMEKRFEHVIKQAEESLKCDSQTPASEQSLRNQTQEPELTSNSDVQPTTQGNADYGPNQLSTLDGSDSTKTSTHAMPGLSADEQTTSLTSTNPPDHEPSDNAVAKNHKQFSHGPSDQVLDQGNQQNEDTCQDSQTADNSSPIRFSSLEKTHKFTKMCVNLCWLMRIQNPPLHMDTELAENSDINTDFYKNYTQNGRKVGYLVWPALFLHKGGPLLCKGIVQPLSNKKG